ncbi:hypothetical protein HOY82DRAFT_553923 [Tuber indicum]|nr:hypothetical protein HOY82DRAFT_553923 [Tuber indicum]
MFPPVAAMLLFEFFCFFIAPRDTIFISRFGDFRVSLGDVDQGLSALVGSCLTHFVGDLFTRRFIPRYMTPNWSFFSGGGRLIC